jgi:hypothetical protein
MSGARAEAALTAYADLHARILDPADRSVPKRFLLLPQEKIWHGLGNQQLTWLYGLLAALLSGRALLGRPFHGAEDCYGFPIRLDPAGLAEVPGYAELTARFRTGDYPGWARAEDLAVADPTDFSPPRYLSLLDGQIAVWDETRGIPHAVFVPVNPHHREKLRETFGPDLLHHLARFLFRPGPRIRAAAAEIEHRMRGRFALGLQLRCGFSSFDLYLSSPRARRLFWTAAQDVLRGREDSVVFLATDSMAARAEARAVFGARLIHTPAQVAPDGDPFTAVLDQHLLTQCNALVVTERSTFGYGAHLLSGVIPWAVDGKLGTVRKRPDSRSGLYKASRWEAPSTWPWQERQLARCPGFTPEMSRMLDPDGSLSGARAALRWLAFLELPIAGTAALRRWRWAVGV